MQTGVVCKISLCKPTFSNLHYSKQRLLNNINLICNQAVCKIIFDMQPNVLFNNRIKYNIANS